jgi:hypothetical protein
MYLSVKNNPHTNKLAWRRYQALITIVGLVTLFKIFSLHSNTYESRSDTNNDEGLSSSSSSMFDPFEIEAGSSGLESFVHLVTVGRLGNQLFEYACSYSIARKLRIPLFLDVGTIAGEDGTKRPADSYFNLHRLHVPIPSDETRTRFLEKVMNSSSKVFQLNDRNILAGEYPVSQDFTVSFCLISLVY